MTLASSPSVSAFPGSLVARVHARVTRVTASASDVVSPSVAALDAIARKSNGVPIAFGHSTRTASTARSSAARADMPTNEMHDGKECMHDGNGGFRV
jgi:hypothetical protein|tara:strand:+ start:146 stop:436 length:291 start_codon:yes stop_codon:yes gene_type:complete